MTTISVGWAIKENGGLSVRSVSPHRRGAIVNFLISNRECVICKWHTDWEIEQFWIHLKGGAEAVKVRIEEVAA